MCVEGGGVRGRGGKKKKKKKKKKREREWGTPRTPRTATQDFGVNLGETRVGRCVVEWERVEGEEGRRREMTEGGREREWGTPRTAAQDFKVNLGKTRVGGGGGVWSRERREEEEERE